MAGNDFGAASSRVLHQNDAGKAEQVDRSAIDLADFNL
jgi:hypothetical protein